MNISNDNYCYTHHKPFVVYYVGGAIVYGCPECRGDTTWSTTTTEWKEGDARACSNTLPTT